MRGNLLQVCASTDHQLQAAHRRYKYGQWLRSLQVEPVMHGMNGKGQKSSSWFHRKASSSPCMCSYISCPGWRNGWHMWYLAVRTLATWAFWNLAIVTNPAICHDKLVNQQAKTLSKPPMNGKWCACRRPGWLTWCTTSLISDIISCTSLLRLALTMFYIF